MLIESYSPERMEPPRYKLLLDAGHAEYGPANLADADTTVVYYHGDPDDPKLHPEERAQFIKFLALAASSPNNWLDQDEDWTALVVITGTIHAHVQLFKTLAAQLMPSLDPAGYTPGGDDDYFDYYPSGMRFLREWALDLQEIIQSLPRQFYGDPGPVAVYMNVAADFVRREAERWVPNYSACANVGYDEFFTSEEANVYIPQLCEFYGLKNAPSGWAALGRKIGLPQRAYVRWNTPTQAEIDHLERLGEKWNPTYTEEQPYKEAVHGSENKPTTASRGLLSGYPNGTQSLGRL